MRILLVEDTASLRNAISDAFDDEGYSVDAVENGEEAFRKLEISEYDLIVLDVVLPDYDGFSILRSIRGISQTPIILLTARDLAGDRMKGLDLGADDYVTKPFDLEELFARMRAVVRRGYGDRSSTISINGISLDTANRRASRKGEDVSLTTLEYSILETLIRQRGEVVSRTTLYEHLYNEDEETLSNMLDRYICKLRSKLGKSFIQTRRGYGYTVEE